MTQKIVVVGNGMVGHKFIEQLTDLPQSSEIELLVFGEAEGVSSLRIWLLDGEEMHYEVFVEGFEFQHARGIGSMSTKVAEVEKLVGSIPGLSVDRVGSRIAMSGRCLGP